MPSYQEAVGDLMTENGKLRAENERLRAECGSLKDAADSDRRTIEDHVGTIERLRALIHNTIEQRWFDYEAAEKILNQQITADGENFYTKEPD